MSETMPSPPEVAELDQEVEELESQRAELLFRWRWAVAGFLAIVLVEVTLISVAIITSNEGMGGAIGGTLMFALFGSVACVGYALDNRNTRIGIRRELQRLKVTRSDMLAGRAKRSAAPYARYKEHLPYLAEHYKVRAQRYRRAYVTLQLVIIVGSLLASAMTALAESMDAKIASIGVSLMVGISASCSLTFRLRERGESLQEMAMGIEREYRASELQIGDYSNEPDDKGRFKKLVERVELMRSDLAAKERSLGQSPDLQQSTTAGIGAV